VFRRCPMIRGVRNRNCGSNFCPKGDPAKLRSFGSVLRGCCSSALPFAAVSRLVNVLVLIWVAWSAPAVLVAAPAFIPGHVYSTGFNVGYIADLDPSLNSAGRITLSNVLAESGATFNDSGNLVLLCQDSSYHTQVREVNAAGQTVRQYDTASGGFLGGSYIDFDPSRRIYVFADDKHLTFLDANLHKIGATADLFGRASGVAFGQDGSVFATDQNDYHVRQFDSTTFAQESVISFPYGYIATGLDVAGNGDLLLTSFGNGAVYRMNPGTGAISQIVPNLGYGMMNCVTELPDGRLLTEGNYGGMVRLYSATGSLLSSGYSDSGIGECAVFYVPEPSTLVFLGVGALSLLAYAWRKRRTT